MKHLQYVQPVALYNADKQQLIGVFATQMLAVRYLYDIDISKRCKQFNKVIARKGKVTDSKIGVPVAVRFASISQVDKLTGDWMIKNGYPEPVITNYKK